MESRLNRTEQDRALPFGWWGHRSSPEQRLSIVDLLKEGNLDARVAAFLWMAVEARASIVVASTIEDAGKTTLLTALLDFLPAEVETIYLRGWYERFDFLDSRDPATTYLLCNEISDNLPTYLWGNGVLRLFESAERGFSLATTIHVDTAGEMIDALSSFPLEVPRRLLGNIDFVLSLSGGIRSSKYLRRLMRVEMLRADHEDVVSETISERDVMLSPMVSRTGRMIGVLTERFGIDRDYATSEFARREQFLEQLQREELDPTGSVRDALLEFARR